MDFSYFAIIYFSVLSLLFYLTYFRKCFVEIILCSSPRGSVIIRLLLVVKNKQLFCSLHMHAGPGCSSVGYGAASELGPLRVRRFAAGLEFNKFAWNKGFSACKHCTCANLLWIYDYPNGSTYVNKSEDWDCSRLTLARSQLALRGVSCWGWLLLHQHILWPHQTQWWFCS